jgi:hypothetical protein
MIIQPISSRVAPVNTPKALIILFNGESGSGGLADNNDATASELEPNPRLLIVQNDNLAAAPVPLDIGTNNLIGHNGLTGVADPEYSPQTRDQVRHGWELGLSERIKAGDFDDYELVCLAKTGQGGSTIDLFTLKGWGYDNIFRDRYQSAKSYVDGLGLESDVVIWWQQGINDALATSAEAHGDDTNAWLVDVFSWFETMRSFVGRHCPIIISELPREFDNYNKAIYSLAALPGNYVVKAREGLLEDAAHYAYAANKAIADRKSDLTLALFREGYNPSAAAAADALAPRFPVAAPINWDSFGGDAAVSGNQLTGTTGGAGAASSTRIDLAFDTTLTMVMTSDVAARGAALQLVRVPEPQSWSGIVQSYIGVFFNTNLFLDRKPSRVAARETTKLQVDRGAGLVDIVTVFPATLSFKVTRAGDVLVFLKNNNADEELVYTAAGYLAGVRFCYARVTFAIPGSKSVAVTLTQPTN